MNKQEFLHSQADLEQRIERSNILYHKCLATVLERWLNKEKDFEDVSLHCIDQKRRLDTLLNEYKQNYQE